MTRETAGIRSPEEPLGPPGPRLSGTVLFFNTLQEVNLFIWSWIWNLIATFFTLTMSIRTVTERAFLLDAEWFSELLGFTRPWQSQVIKTRRKIWDQFTAKIPKPIKDALQKLDALRENGHRKTVQAAREILRTLEDTLRLWSVPVVDTLRMLVSSLFRVHSAETLSATRGAEELLAAETRAKSAHDTTESWLDDVVEAVNNLIGEDGLLQARTWLWSQDRHYAPATNLQLNRMISTEPQEEYDRLTEEYPIRTYLDRFSEIATLELLADPHIDQGIDLFRSLVGWQPEGQ